MKKRGPQNKSRPGSNRVIPVDFRKNMPKRNSFTEEEIRLLLEAENRRKEDVAIGILFIFYTVFIIGTIYIIGAG